ncbi:hypothetical protein PybrP1_011007 [[Pythium] brassicae (nom. inval.)]|nr:hypothetical protein PybrP1_011007 [[Pythium] brassicae (nom. inval.)]
MQAPSLSPPLPLELVAPFCSTRELARLSLLDVESARACEPEWRARVLARFGSLRFRPAAWRRCFALRAHLARRVVDTAAARVYLMNGRGETRLLALRSSRSLPCSRERAAVYSRCERMFELSLRINRSVQEISALVGAVSPDEARALLREHLGLLASVASLRGSLLFESELFPVFPAPVLLDANALLRGTLTLCDEGHMSDEGDGSRTPTLRFTDSSTLMMQVWASIDGLIYRPLAPPALIEPFRSPAAGAADDSEAGELPAPAAVAEAAAAPAERDYNVVRLHDLSGMTINIDDNTLRYRLHAHELCVNALVSNAYLLYVFNPLGFRPLDWTFHAAVLVDGVRYALPVQREGVFLNTVSHALRVFLSYGKIPDSGASTAAAATSNSRPRGGEDSAPLDIPCADGDQVVAFRLTATNRISKRECEVVAKTSLLSTSDRVGDRASSPDAESIRSDSEADKLADVDQTFPAADSSSSLLSPPPPLASATERHVHLPYDAMICYNFSPRCALQYIEFAIGFEPLMHQLGVSPFLHESVAPA